MTWAPDYITTATLKAYLRVSDAVDDAQMALAVTAASRAVDLACNRQFGAVSAPEARYFTGYYDKVIKRWVCEIDDLGDLTGLTVAVDTDDTGTYADAVTPFAPRPFNATAVGRVYTSIVVGTTAVHQLTHGDGQIKVTGQWGWTSVPTPVQQATLFQASRFMARRDSPYGVSGSPNSGGELRLLSRLDPDVAVALRPYIRWWGSV